MISMCLLLQRGNSCAKIKCRNVTKDGIEGIEGVQPGKNTVELFLPKMGVNWKLSNPELFQTCFNGVTILLTGIIIFTLTFKHYNNLKT
jgi:hypothetical protein